MIARFALTLAVLAALAVVPSAAGAADPPRTQLLSQSASGGFPNGPSRNAAFSQDRQRATFAAYESDASNIVSGDDNRATDIFLVHRADPISLRGPPWHAGRTQLISRGMNGDPANGRSYVPDLDGEQLYEPSCVAFVSEADNLVPGDTNGKADAFVYYLRTNNIQRVSVGNGGVESNGTTYEVKVDGHCDRVAFVSDATNLALTGTRVVSRRTAVTGPAPDGVRQVYVRVLGKKLDNIGLEGLTFLASASDSGEPGNRDSGQISMARSGGGCGRQGRCGDYSGEDVFFASQATNLAALDTDTDSDIYRRTFPRRVVRIRLPRPREIDGVELQTLQIGVGPLRLRTSLVTKTSEGEPANGPSFNPSANDSGRYVAFETRASNLLRSDTNQVSDVALGDTSDGSMAYISRLPGGPAGDGPSGNPSVGRVGNEIFYESAATNLEQNDKNCVGDIFNYYGAASGQTTFFSLDSEDRIPNAPFGTQERCPRELSAPAVNPVVSYYVNYLMFETSYPLMDVPLARRVFPGLENDLPRAARMSREDPSLHQVYLRYVGPR